MAMEIASDMIAENEGACGNTRSSEEVTREHSLFTDAELYNLCLSCGENDCGPPPTHTPTSFPTSSPTSSPSSSPTESPTSSPTSSPTANPTDTPTSAPTDEPTNSPTPSPTDEPTPEPTSSPTETPTSSPTANPTSTPTSAPTSTPTSSPTESPTAEPTAAPTDTPTSTPTNAPTKYPTSDLIQTLVDQCEKENNISYTEAQECCSLVQNNSDVFAGCIYDYCVSGGETSVCQEANNGIEGEKERWWTQQLESRPTFELLLEDEATLSLADAYDHMIEVVTTNCFPDEAVNEAFHMGRMRLVENASYWTENPNYKFWDGGDKPVEIKYPLYLLVWLEESLRGTKEGCGMSTDSAMIQHLTTWALAASAFLALAQI